MRKLLEECLGSLYELQAHIEWKRHVVKYNDSIEMLDDLIERVSLKALGAPLKRHTNKGKCDLGLALEAHRIKRDMKVLDMAIALDCTGNSYRNWIRGASAPSKKARRKIAKLIGKAWL